MEKFSIDYSGFEGDFNEDYLWSQIDEQDITKYNEILKSWLQFNYRVLHEASKDSNPIMERLNFIGIADSNLDEFIRTKFKINKGLRTSISEQTKQIEAIYDKTLEELKDKYSIAIVHTSELREDSKAYTKLKSLFNDSEKYKEYKNGDIVAIFSEEKYAWIVVFEDGGEEMYLNEYDDMDDVWVIGNIHDTPKHLKGE